MKKSTKAVLLSALVFPGVGHLYLKKTLFGGLLAIASFVCIYDIMSKMMQNMQQMVDRMQSGYVPPDMTAMLELASSQTAGMEAHLSGTSAVIFVILWLVAVFDSYRVGVVLDKEDDTVVER